MKIHWYYKGPLMFILLTIGLTYLLIHGDTPEKRIDRCLQKFEEIKSFSVYGRIIGKYIDAENHSYPLIYVQRPNGTSVRVNLTLDHNHLYDSLSFGDLFKKETGEATIYYGKDSLNKSIKIDYNCDNWQHRQKIFAQAILRFRLFTPKILPFLNRQHCLFFTFPRIFKKANS